MDDRIFSPGARRHAKLLGQAVAPFAARLERRFLTRLRRHGLCEAGVRACLAITPAAASRCASLRDFLEQVEYNGRRLAKLNISPAEVKGLLQEFGRLLDDQLGTRFQPAREQLLLATLLAVEGSFHRVREAEVQAFFGLYRAEIEARDLDDLLRRSIRVLTRTFEAPAGRLLLFEEEPAEALSKPLYIAAGQPAEELIGDPAMRGRFACYWSHPMGKSAVAQFGFRVPYPWLPRELALLGAAAERCRDAIERARLESEVRRLDRERRRAEEEERRRIGRELHDEAGQSLLLLRLQLELIERAVPAEFRGRLAGAREIVERTVGDLRRLVAALSPAVLERLGLERALRQLAARFRKMHPAHIRLRLPTAAPSLPAESQQVIYRVAQECLQNIAKHSGATGVNLSLRVADKSIRLSVSDNGAGFSAKTVGSKPMSFGLAGMRERAALVGGTLEVRSTPGKGTRIALILPRPAAQVAANG